MEKAGLQQFQLMAANSKVSLGQFKQWQVLQQEQNLSMASFLKIKEYYLPQAPRCYFLTNCEDEFESEITTAKRPELEEEFQVSNSTVLVENKTISPSTQESTKEEQTTMYNESAESTRKAEQGTEETTENPTEIPEERAEETSSRESITQEIKTTTSSTISTGTTFSSPATPGPTVVLTTSQTISLIPGMHWLVTGSLVSLGMRFTKVQRP